MRSVILISALCVGVLAACSMESGTVLLPGSKGEEPTASELSFDKYVKPLLESTCKDCHSNPNDEFGAPDFLDVKPGDYYSSLVSRKDFVSCNVDNSLLLIQGLDPEHPGGALTPPQHDKVKVWLENEAIDRFDGICKGSATLSEPGGGSSGETEVPSGPLTGLDALTQFGDCMTLEDWKATGMPSIAQQTALNQKQQTPCSSCHQEGNSGSNWMPDPEANNAEEAIVAAFEHMRRTYEIFNLVRWTVKDEEGEDGSFEDLVQSYRWRDKGKDPGHPPYELDAKYVEILETWFKLTYDKWKAGPCKP